MEIHLCRSMSVNKKWSIRAHKWDNAIRQQNIVCLISCCALNERKKRGFKMANNRSHRLVANAKIFYHCSRIITFPRFELREDKRLEWNGVEHKGTKHADRGVHNKWFELLRQQRKSAKEKFLSFRYAKLPGNKLHWASSVVALLTLYDKQAKPKLTSV